MLSSNLNTDGDASTAYFRGRKLHGKTVKFPEGYRGVIAAKTEKQPSPENHSDVVDLEREDEPGKLQVQAEFDDMVIWGHEATADVSSDPYVRGMEEWLALSEQVCGDPSLVLSHPIWLTCLRFTRMMLLPRSDVTTLDRLLEGIPSN